MIVRNEGLTIKRCLESVKNSIDYFVICDTGSTDNTKEIITEFFKKHNIKGKLYEKPWVNFEVNRTEALKLAKGKTDYILLIDADMQLVVHDPDWKNKIPYDTCLVNQENDSLRYANTRVISGNLDYRYVSVTHEYIECISGGTTGKLDSIGMIDHADGGTRGEKFERDIRLLLKGIEDNPNNARYAFYLANSYRDAGQKGEAVKWYKKRTEMGGWIEEVWNSFLNMGRCYQSMEDWPNALDSYLKAYSHHRGRLESLYEIAKYYRENNMPVAGWLFADMGMRIPYPKNDTLFIEKNVYDYLMKYEMSICTCYVNDLKTGRQLCDELIFSRNTPGYIRSSCLNNIYFYLEKLGGTVIEELTVAKTKPSHNLCNPSIVSTLRGFILSIREVSYTFNIAANSYSYDKTIDTYNHLVNMDTKKKGVLAQLMDAPIALYENYITGLEDIRLFEHESELWGIGTSRITNPTGINEMVAVKIGEDYSITAAIRMKGYKDDECQKNWVPINYNGSIHFIYSSDPLILLKPNFDTGECTVAVNRQPKYNMSNFRGSSQAIQFGDGYLYVVHEVIHKDNRRYYYHRFVLVDSNLDVPKISEPFYFIDRTIEYCSGMCQVGDELWITIGYEDKRAHLIKMPVKRVVELLDD